MRARVTCLAAALLLILGCGKRETEDSAAEAGDEALAAPTAALPSGCRVAAAAVAPGAVSFAVLSGDLNQHADVAARFLDGCSTGCATTSGLPCVRTPGLHVPAAASARLLHRDRRIADYRPFFVDSLQHGDDGNGNEGLEQANVVVYAGHGVPTAISTYGFVAHPPPKVNGFEVGLDSLRLGDGAARYLLMFSCAVMAHGPLDCGPGRLPFGCPEKFTLGAPAAAGQRDVLTSWRDRLGPNLRIACGGSSSVYSLSGPAAFWQAFSGRRHLPVADAYLLAMSQKGAVPICIAHGGANPADSPLVTDTTFSQAPLEPGQRSFLYAMYPVTGDPRAVAVVSALQRLAGEPRREGDSLQTDNSGTALPLLELAPTTVPEPLGGPVQGPDGAKPFGFREVPKGPLLERISPVLDAASKAAVEASLEVAVHPRSGAGSVRFRLPSGPAANDSASLEQVVEALEIDGGQVARGFDGSKVSPEIEAVAMRIDRLDPATGQRTHFDGCVYGRLRNWIKVAGKDYPLLDEGGVWELRSCPAGFPGAGPPVDAALGQLGTQSLDFVGRRVTQEVQAVGPPVGDRVATRRAQERLAEYVGFVGDPMTAYDQLDHVIGYVAAPSHCGQERMQPVHRFHFARKGIEDEIVEIDVPVHEAALEEPSCSPAPP